MSSPRAIVTGGAGFIGSHLCERLVDDGYEVLCVDSLITGDPANLMRLENERRFHLLEHDVAHSLEVSGGADALLHLASPASPVDYLRFPLQTLDAGSRGTGNVLALARETGARFLLASTSEVYGDPQVHPQREDYVGHVNPIGPRSVYDEAKRFSESLTMAYHREHGVATSIVRIFNTYGPRMRPHDGRAVPTFVSQCLSGQPITVTGDGTQTRSMCYVDDLVEGIARVLHHGGVGPYNLGNPEEITILDLARRVRDLCGADSWIDFIASPVDDPRRRIPDIARVRKDLGWEPRVALDDGLERTVLWMAAQREDEHTRPATIGPRSAAL
ncbi:NAD-dependent epimerase/dehydratase family protein [Nocardiopsis sp. YSL2]|uniref:NAD-dependent epimerase/dehydratase family protein n=1 Tax=Nocardiopsis sp. YSL2 TaxID=2939492 RepID=UPI0026F40DCE|nr:NAD-dependent epimerase/dehydratase family protein [Nocardiopsis sp. YSL2]